MATNLVYDEVVATRHWNVFNGDKPELLFHIKRDSLKTKDKWIVYDFSPHTNMERLFGKYDSFERAQLACYVTTVLRKFAEIERRPWESMANGGTK